MSKVHRLQVGKKGYEDGEEREEEEGKSFLEDKNLIGIPEVGSPRPHPCILGPHQVTEEPMEGNLPLHPGFSPSFLSFC